MHNNYIRKIAKDELIDETTLLGRIEKGTIVLVKNKKRDIAPLGIGQGLKVK